VWTTMIRPPYVLLAMIFAAPAWADPPADASAAAPAAAPATAPATAPPPAAASAPVIAPARHLVLPAGALVPLRFMEAVASDVNVQGGNFRMEVTDDIAIDDAVVIPAGSIAMGEVIHAQRAGAFGKAGELIVSARYVLVGEREIKLRSNLGNSGQSKVGAAFFVPFIHGKQAIIPMDTEVLAKTAKEESFDVPTPVAH